MPKTLFAMVALAACSTALIGCGGGIPGIGGGALTTPTITGITPNPVTRGQAITVSGVNLAGTFTTVYFSGFGTGTSGASSGGTTSVIASVPTNLSAGSYSVYVITSDANGDFSSPSNTVTLALN